MTDFASLGLSERVLAAVTKAGYDTATPIQEKAIPVVLEGRDLIGLAQTGTGKTAAFVLPLIDQLLAEDRRAPAKAARALILAPTRELAAQIGVSVRTYAAGTKLTSTVIFGGVKYGPQIKGMARGVDILIATPGRLQDHMRSGHVRLDHTTRVALDEGDQMLDLGFMPAIRQILSKLARDRQTVMFSATMAPDIRKLTDEFLTNPQTVAVTPASKPAERVEQSVLFAPAGDKAALLVELLANEVGAKTIIFTRTKRGADRVAKRLVEYGHSANAIHGDKSQGQRERALKAFKAGTAPVLVATDIAARGIDVQGVALVINYELPEVAESYVHRIGRTARAGAEGRAIALCSPEERGLLRAIVKLTGIAPEGYEDAPPAPKKADGKPKRRSRNRNRGPQGKGKSNAKAKSGSGARKKAA